MTGINITKVPGGRARIDVNGRTYTASYDAAARTWVVQTDNGPFVTGSAKLHSCMKAFVQVNGATKPSAPRVPRQPRTTTPRAPRVPGRRRGRGGPAFSTPKPTTRDQKLVVVSALTDLMALNIADKGVTPEATAGFERFQKLLALALGPCSSTAAQTEADSALRMAAIQLVKLAF